MDNFLIALEVITFIFATSAMLCTCLLIHAIYTGKFTSHSKQNIPNNSGDKYPMCDSQLSQIDCRITDCTYNTGGGNCSNVNPAIVLNNNEYNTFVCWSQKELEEESL